MDKIYVRGPVRNLHGGQGQGGTHCLPPGRPGQYNGLEGQTESDHRSLKRCGNGSFWNKGDSTDIKSKNKLEGEMSFQIGKLTNLEGLFLDNNQLSVIQDGTEGMEKPDLIRYLAIELDHKIPADISELCAMKPQSE